MSAVKTPARKAICHACPVIADGTVANTKHLREREREKEVCQQYMAHAYCEDGVRHADGEGEAPLRGASVHFLVGRVDGRLTLQWPAALVCKSCKIFLLFGCRSSDPKVNLSGPWSGPALCTVSIDARWWLTKCDAGTYWWRSRTNGRRGLVGNIGR